MKYFFIALFVFSNCIYSQPTESNFWELTNGPFGQKITTIDVLNQDSIIVGTNGSGVFLYSTSISTWKNIYSDSSYTY